ncbi:MAG TPA: hypothetical protein VM123_03345 [archaeon]|nr:hypothetical protein [archaeon]
MSLFEENENLLEMIEDAEAKVEKIKITGVDSAAQEEKTRLAVELKTFVSRLVDNIAASKGDVQALGGALVLVDLLEVLKRYKDIFNMPKLDKELDNLEQMWESSH